MPIKSVDINFSPAVCNISTPLPPEVNAALYASLAVHTEGYFFSPAFQSGRWDGYSRLYKTKSQSFRSGLLSRVCGVLSEHEYAVNVTGKPPAVITTFSNNSPYTLRPYLKNAVIDVLKHRFGILQAPMRSGKTVIFISVLDELREFPAVFFCRSLDLAYQTVDRLKEFLPDVSVGLIGDGKSEVSCDVTVVTIQSAFSAYGRSVDKKDLKNIEVEKPVEDRMAVVQLLKKAKTIFYDEAHHTQSKTSRFILDRCMSATMKIGLTATPKRDIDEDMLIEETIGTVIHKISYSQLIREGFILRPIIYAYKIPAVGVDGTYPTVYKHAVVENEFLTGLISKICQRLMSMGKSVVVQATIIKHVKLLYKAIPNSHMLIGTDTSATRKDILDRLRSKDILCVVSTLFEEGIDIPSLDYTINAAGGLSSISTLQRMRSITAVDGKETCGVIDFIHSDKYVSRHSKTRLDLYRDEEEFKVHTIDLRKKSLEEIT